MLRLLILLLICRPAFPQAPSFQGDDTLASARTLFKQGKFQDAAAAYRAIVQKDKTSAPAYAGLVQSYLKSDDVSAADDISAQALQQLPNSAVIHAARGDVYFRQSLLFKAQSEYQLALKLDENCARAWLGMGKIYSAVSLNQQAKNFFDKAHELDPDDGDAWYRWAVLLPYPDSVSELEKHLAGNRSTREEERREREFIELLKGISGREVWIGPPETTSEIKLELLAPQPGFVPGLGARVNFNDSVTSTLLLDTGASWITIPRKLAEKIGARKISDYAIEGVGGEEPTRGYFAWVDKVTIGNVDFHDCVVHVTPKNDVGEDGVLGIDVFSKYLLTIDFAGRRLRLAPLPPAILISREMLASPIAEHPNNGQAFNFGHLLLLPTEVNHSAGLFVLDTGSNSTSISPALAKRAGKPRAIDKRVIGARGQVDKVSVLVDADVNVFGLSVWKNDLIVFDRRSLSQQLGTEVSGFIGFDALRRLRLSINYRDGWVKVEAGK